MPLDRNSAGSQASGKWLSLVGLGESGWQGLAPEARRAVEGAAFVFGGARHLALAKDIIGGEARPWPQPFDTALTQVRELAGQNVCVLASGDPFCHGVGATLARFVAPSQMAVYPAPSAFSLAAGRLGWSLADCDSVSLHGRPLDLLRPLLHPGRRVLALTSDGQTPALVAGLLCQSGFGASTVHVLEALGGPRERLTRHRADTLAGAFDPLNLVAIEVRAESGAAVLPIGAAWDEALFEHDGQITKGPIRAMTLAALGPRRGETLWDIGAGSGSIAISWMLCHSSLRAVAVEENGERAARATRNAARCGVPDLALVEGQAPAALEGLARPNAVFVGGGGGDPAVIGAALEALAPGGRLVANAVTLETERALLERHSTLGGELIRLDLSRASPVGSMTGWRPAMPVTQWRWMKP